MLSIRRSEVPAYLQESDFYVSLSADDDGEISVPQECFKCNTTVSDEPTLRNLLSTLRFWGVHHILEDVYVGFNALSEIDPLVNDFASEFPYLKVLRDLRNLKSVQVKDRLILAIRAGSLETLTFLLERSKTPVRSTQLCCVAAECGHLHCLKYLHDQKCAWDSEAYKAAASRRHLHCLKYLYEHDDTPPNDVGLLGMAVAGGSMECMKYLVEQKCELSSHLFNIAAQRDSDTMCGYLHTQNVAFPDNFTQYLADNDSTRCLQFALTHGFTVNDSELYRVKSIRFLHIMHIARHTWTVHSCSKVAYTCKVELLQYLHEVGCPWDAQTTQACVNNVLNIDCLIYAHEQGCPWNERTAMLAVSHRNRLAVNYMHAQGFEFPTDFVTKCVEKGGLEMLHCAHKLALPWDEGTVRSAVSRGKIDCLKYLVEHQCPVPVDVCKDAGQAGSLPMLQYLHNKGFKLVYLTPNHLNRTCIEYVETHMGGGVPTAVASLEWVDTDQPVVVVEMPNSVKMTRRCCIQ